MVRAAAPTALPAGVPTGPSGGIPTTWSPRVPNLPRWSCASKEESYAETRFSPDEDLGGTWEGEVGSDFEGRCLTSR